MSTVEDAEGHHHEIIIVRHGGGDHDEGHHGGAWKIAFADFMTAMMCFFLVMWLINAANEQTKAAVASYFNPVKLIDRNSSRKGLEDIGDGPNAVGTEADEPQTPDSTAGTFGQANSGPEKLRNSDDAKKALEYSDEHLFADPYSVLAEIVADTGTKANLSSKGDGGASDAGPATGASGGESYRDPFAPDFWSEPDQVSDPSDPMAGVPKEERTAAAEAAEAKATEAGPDAVEALIAAADDPTKKVEEVIAVAKAPAEPSPETKPAEEKTPEEKAAEAKAEKQEDVPTPETIAAANEIQKELTKVLGEGGKLDDGISVVPTAKGVTISVTDKFDFGMFEIGSALPHRELVLAMEKIAGVISTREGQVMINGHTDGRPFKGGNYDNWRLSTARAHSAYYMLVRAGLGEKRVVEVAGFADRKLKNTADPFDAANRRIEILLEIGG